MPEVCKRCAYRLTYGKSFCKYKDIGYVVIHDDKGDIIRECDYHKSRDISNLWEKSGIDITGRTYSFQNYETYNESTKYIKSLAMKYALSFDSIRNTKFNSLALLGQVGSGKSHLSIAVANYLINKGIKVRYFQFSEVILILKQNRMHEEAYIKEVSKYKDAEILLIDDLFKKGKNNRIDSVTDSDVKIMFEIINYRYVKRLPIIVSSELFLDDLCQIDEGLGSRIAYMAKSYLAEIEGRENNYRLLG